MSYTRALYYPTIDIEDEEWIKNAILFWDEIDTIVPLSISDPYQNNSSSYLFEEGILKPIFLKPEDSVLEKVEQQIFKFSEKEEALSFLLRTNNDMINPYGDFRAVFYLHRDKFPLKIQDYLEEKQLIDNEGWAKVSDNFADYYMTLLATELAKKKHMCLLTGSYVPYDLSTSYCFDKVNSSKYAKTKIADSILFKMVISGFKIPSTVSLCDLLDYKQRRKDELGRFRSALAGLTDQKNFDGVESIEEMKENVHAIYKNDFLPALNAVRDTLHDRGITFIEKMSNYIMTFFAPSLFLNDINELSCAIGTGASLVYWGALEQLKTRKVKRSSSYSYLLSLKNDGKIVFDN